MARFHNYSFNNTVLICAQKPDATYVAGYSTWKKLGRWPVKGSHAIRILAPARHGKLYVSGKIGDKRKDGRIFPLHIGSKTRRTGKETGQKNRPEKNAKEVITNGNT